MIKETSIENLLKLYCNNDIGCKWEARRNKILNYVKITQKNKGPDIIEFLERNKATMKDLPKNIRILELSESVLILKDPVTNKLRWFLIKKK